MTANKGTPGEPGGLFFDGANGADGEDKWYELSCLSIGPSFYSWSYPKTVASFVETGSPGYHGPEPAKAAK
jgi:hypothetical protein